MQYHVETIMHFFNSQVMYPVMHYLHKMSEGVFKNRIIHKMKYRKLYVT